MAFQNLRTGSTVYIFYKDSSPKLEVGQVIAEPEIRQKYPMPNQGQPQFTPNFMPQPQEQVIDLSVRIGEKVQPIKGLPLGIDIQDCGNGLYVSCSRDALNAEVAAYKHISDVALDPKTIATHKVISKNCADIIAQLNPEIAERQRIEAENKELKSELLELKNMVGSLLEQLGGSNKSV